MSHQVLPLILLFFTASKSVAQSNCSAFPPSLLPAVTPWSVIMAPHFPGAEDVIQNRIAESAQKVATQVKEKKLPAIFADFTQEELTILISSSRQSVNCFSQRPLIWLDLFLILDESNSDFARLFWHEYFHIVHDHLRPHEKDWLREGLAIAFETLQMGVMNPRVLDAAFRAPDHLLFGESNPDFSDEFYGLNGAFIASVLRQCGGQELFWRLMMSPSPARGLPFLIETLASTKGCEDISSLRQNFTLARWINRKDQQLFPTLHRWHPRILAQASQLRTFLAQAAPMEAIGITSELALQLPNICPSCRTFRREPNEEIAFSHSPIEARAQEILLFKP